MNHTANLNGNIGNQIDLLANAGYFSGPVPSSHILPVYAQSGDTNASREFRVRSYLAVNCGQCHQANQRGGGVWDAYIRMKGVKEFYKSINDKVEIIRPLQKQPYGDWEFEVKDPNGYVLVFSELIQSD